MSVLRFRNNETGEWQEIVTIKGDTGATGPAGKDGKDYVLTQADKEEIAGMIDVPSSGGGNGGNWYWNAADNPSKISSIYNRSHVRVVGYWDDDDQDWTTFDISAPYDSWFDDCSGSNFTFSGKYGAITFMCDGDSLETTDDVFSIQGYYYWE